MKLEFMSIAAADLPGSSAARLAASHFKNRYLYYCGLLEILEKPLTAFFCSRRVSSADILQAYDQAVKLRSGCQAIIGGFHTPVERDCLKILLKGSTAIVLCLARGPSPTILRGFPKDLHGLLIEALEAGRLLFLSPFSPEVRRASQVTAKTRNDFVLTLVS